MQRPVITLLTDFGLTDHYVGAMKGVILCICPDAQLVDITHEIQPYSVPDAAYTLSQAWSYFPAGTIHLIVVDPGVGSARRPMLAEAGGHYFVAPDNGVLTAVLNAFPGHEARAITADRYFRQPVSQTFHGRDIFAPVAAHLAGGVPPSAFGERIEDHLRLVLAKPERTASGAWTGSIQRIDRFGNIVTNFDRESFGRVSEQPFQLQVGPAYVTRYAATYAAENAGQLFVIGGSAGYLEVSANQGNAAQILGVATGAPLRLNFPVMCRRRFCPTTGRKVGHKFAKLKLSLLAITYKAA